MAESTADWPRGVQAPAGAPNVVVILLDDVGFGAASTFGGPAHTRELDRLAAQGLRFNRFHVTALCSPTRASLLSGRNDHRTGFGTLADDAKGFPGYNAIWRKDCVTIAEVLRRNGYSTAAFGKWHNTPVAERTPAGPFDRWPTSLGFEYFYGFLAGNDSQWEPTLFRNTILVPPPATPERGYHLTTDLATDAIRWLRTHQALAPDRPYFLYFAPGATHSPLQVAREWSDKYLGRFGQGWDKLREEIYGRQKKLGVVPSAAELTPRPKELPAWDSLSPEAQKLCARQMEVYAGFLEQTDHEVGRLLKEVEAGAGGSNTLVFYIAGDNGADAKGGPDGKEDQYSPPESMEFRLRHIGAFGDPERLGLYASGWAWATCAPFQWEKRIASHLGGTRAPLVVSWPAAIRRRGEIRAQYTHVNDVAPTICEAAGISFPTVVDGVAQMPLDGISFRYAFENAESPSRHRLQIFEQIGNRAIYSDGWVAAVRHSVPWLPVSGDYSNEKWELYHLDADFSQARDLAAQQPEKLRELRQLFETEARKNGIYPLYSGVQSKDPAVQPARREYVFLPDIEPIPSKGGPNFKSAHSITVDLQIPPEGAEGVLVSDGGRSGGFVLYVKDDHLVYENNVSGFQKNSLASAEPLPRGRLQVSYEFAPSKADENGSGGTGRLFVNGGLSAEGEFKEFGRPVFGAFEIGQARIARVSSAYSLPFKFSGVLERVKVELK